MFDTYSNKQSLNINAVSGTILKTYKDSFMLRFHMNSQVADKLLSKNPTLQRKHQGEYSSYDQSDPVVVLQVMICGDQQLLAEVMWKEDFDKLFNDEGEEE